MSSKTRLEYIANTQTLVGSQQKRLMDMDTGEQILVDQITKRIYGTKNFWKVYLMDFLTALGIIDNRQLDVFIYIMENTDARNNLFIGTYEKISKDVGACRQTIARLMKKLQDNGFIRRVQNGVWMVNPNIVMKGNDTRRQILLSYYESEEPIDKITVSRVKRPLITDTDEEQLEGQSDIYDYLPDPNGAPPQTPQGEPVPLDPRSLP